LVGFPGEKMLRWRWSVAEGRDNALEEEGTELSRENLQRLINTCKRKFRKKQN
jgi:hypothetical protein